ncbi:MAG: TolC family protein [Myxococcota bacterium]|nr:TolC family protein [Myxococcota bacterium]
MSFLALLLLRPALAGDVPETSEYLVEQAITHSPSLDALQAREQALRSQVEAAGVWADPSVSLEYSNVPLVSPTLSSSMMAGVQVRAFQTLRPRGWSALAQEHAALEADAAGLAIGEATLQLTVSVQQTWWLLVRSRLLQAVTAEHIARAEELLSAARTRYETGSLGQHAVLRLEVLSAQLTDGLQDFTLTEQELLAALTVAIGERPSLQPTPASVSPQPPPEDRDWLAIARTHRPLLERLQADTDIAEASGALARADGRPDISVWAGYRVRTAESQSDRGEDLVSVGLSVPIPVGSADRADAAVAAASQQAAAAGHTLQAAEVHIDANMETTLARWIRADDKATHYRDRLIPGAQAVLETTQADFSVGRADFASLFEAEVALLSLKRAYIIAATETRIQHAAAIATLGTSPLGAQP